ncbi:MAG: amidase [Acidobacteria bacterium]|nr:amidase [Acidobacteriota bacterium]
MRDQLRSGALTPSELMESHIAAIERDNPRLNAFTELFLEQARAAARAPRPGPLSGIPLTIKASLSYDSTAARRLRHAGAILLGRTNTPPFLMNYETGNSETGRTNNPLDVTLTPGGSSGGEAAAIAACMSAGGIGSDGGGSIRWPAHCCRIAGMKPTPGRIPATGHTPECLHPGGLLGVIGPMARTCDDLQLLFEAVAGHDSSDPFSAPVPMRPPPDPLRPAPDAFPPIALVDAWPLDDAIRARLHFAARLLNAHPSLPPLLHGALNRAHELWRFFFWRVNWVALKPIVEGPPSKGKPSPLHPLALEWFHSVRLQPEPTAHELIVNLTARDRLRAHFLDAMEQYPVLLCAPATIEPFPHGDRSRFSLDCVRPLSFANLLGLPALVTSTGVQLVGRPWEEGALLAIGRHLEAQTA